MGFTKNRGTKITKSDGEGPNGSATRADVRTVDQPPRAGSGPLGVVAQVSEIFTDQMAPGPPGEIFRSEVGDGPLFVVL